MGISGGYGLQIGMRGGNASGSILPCTYTLAQVVNTYASLCIASLQHPYLVQRSDRSLTLVNSPGETTLKAMSVPKQGVHLTTIPYHPFGLKRNTLRRRTHPDQSDPQLIQGADPGPVGVSLVVLVEMNTFLNRSAALSRFVDRKT